MMIDTGDIVRHKPTGEEWVVACVIDDKLSPCGWPECRANLNDCELIESADDESRLKLLQEMADISEPDHRARYARERLKNHQLQPALQPDRIFRGNADG